MKHNAGRKKGRVREKTCSPIGAIGRETDVSTEQVCVGEVWRWGLKVKWGKHWWNNNQQEISEARWPNVCVRAVVLKLWVMVPWGTAQSITLEKRKGQATICTRGKGLTPPFCFTAIIVICSSTFFTTWLLALWTDWKASWKSQAERQLWKAWDVCLPVLPFWHRVLVSETVSEHGAGVQQLALVISFLDSVASITIAFAFLHAQFPHSDRCSLEYFPVVGGIVGEGIHLHCHDPKWPIPPFKPRFQNPGLPLLCRGQLSNAQG